MLQLPSLIQYSVKYSTKIFKLYLLQFKILQFSHIITTINIQFWGKQHIYVLSLHNSDFITIKRITIIPLRIITDVYVICIARWVVPLIISFRCTGIFLYHRAEWSPNKQCLLNVNYSYTSCPENIFSSLSTWVTELVIIQ